MIFLKALSAGYEKNIDESKIIKYTREIILQLLHFLAASLLSSINEAGAFSPFGVSFVCAVKNRFLISSAFGSGIGYILTQDSTSALKYIAAVLCSAVLIRLTGEFESFKRFRLIPSCTAFLMLFLTSMAVLFAEGINLKAFFIFLGEAGVGFASAYIFAGVSDALSLFDKAGGMRLADAEKSGFLISLILFSLSGIEAGGISPARIILILLLLVTGYVYSQSAAALGIACALVFSLGERFGTAAPIYAAGPLLMGLFPHLGRLAQCFAFAAAYVTGFIFFGGEEDKLPLLAELFAATLIFCIVPEKVYMKLRNILTVKAEPQSINSRRRAVFNKLGSVSSALGDISYCVEAASDLAKTDFAGGTVGFYTSVRDTACADCNIYGYCWEKNFNRTKNSFDEMSEKLKRGEKIRSDSLPDFLNSCCNNKSEIAESFTENYIRYINSKSVADRAEQLRRLTSEQFSGICEMLSEIGDEFSDEIAFDDKLTQEITTSLAEHWNLTVQDTVCTRDSAGRLRIEIHLLQKAEKLRENEFVEMLEAISGVSLSPPVVTQTQESIAVTLCERTRYRIEAAAVRICADGEKECGDSYEGFYDGRGNYFAVLSDGMGTGLRAAVDSSLTSVMTARLLRAGISLACAVRLVNSALLLRSADESLATFDAVKINLYTGKVVFCKAGGGVSFVKRRGKTRSISFPSMPLGILREVNCAEKSVMLGTNDLVMLASDGATEYDTAAVADSFSVSLSESAEEICRRTAECAKRLRKGRHTDDITVITLRVKDNT
ncbi:MAG: hypothetical protein E7514_01200 [Ruminococcaceae bacterium]|nr:hypothetical protein [Oscillospiraceae bacterium]